MSDENKGPGRPPEYPDEIFYEICRIYANTKQSLQKICDSDKRFPNRDTFYERKAKDKELSDMYARARISQIELRIDEIFEEAADDSKDILYGADGPRPNMAAVNRSRTKIDTLKWTASKVIPKVYGDKLELTDSTTNYDERNKSTAELSERINAIINQSRPSENVEAGSEGTDVNSSAD